ncbi:septation initiation protein [Citrobacter youngae]|nr:septation initiation protein [Citrobacter youngae]MCO4165266.1 septation initiation protein [Citrobacter youngae]
MTMTDKTLTAALPASVQSALEKVNTIRNAWVETRRKQESAASQADIIRQRRAETEANATAQNEEWRRLFRENGGVMTPEMKKLRAEVVLDRESLEEFDALLALHAQESEFLPWVTADRAKDYISAHNALVQLRAMQLWQDFMQAHGEPLIQTLSLLKITLGREASFTTGVVRGVNDPESVLREFISKNITQPALEHNALPEQDAAFRLAGVFPDQAARTDFSRSPTPAARKKMLTRREMAQKEQAQ